MQATSDKILHSALVLMKEKGYQSVSIKEIAQDAKVSEMTIFRHFKNKLGVFEAAVEKFSYVPCFEDIFSNQITWDFEKDLTLIAKSYFDLMEKNKPIFLIAVQERSAFPELSKIIADKTMQLKQLIIAYFSSMQDKGLIKVTDVEAQTMIFLTTLYGYFSSTSLWEDHYLHEWKDSFVFNTVQLFYAAYKK